ncbi:hypothetical protein FN846DRAFT_981614 [Sphaerosporella brunnea]|uniref:Fe2OG dioxygenase domain-containing protein n=1 Tax=Sphaerosporella brunnea TaxID=1250544 RepID=A0A5J5EDP9_9PEZI|nr:hypothetical protein FN846DRAFT_981614 [Sphaerosporella brunnea]
MQSTSQRALLVIGLQKEFLDPPTGRCLLPDVSPCESQQPGFLNNIAALLPRFRALGGDVVWVRSESRARRDFTDPRAEETILVLNESDSEDDEDPNSGDPLQRATRPSGAAKILKTKGGKVGGPDGTGPSRPPLLTDAYLSIDTQHPPVTRDTPASEWHVPVLPLMCVPPDRVVTKSWYSAFKDTGLLLILRGRIVTQLVIVGLMTNVDVLATAADAARHGFEVWVLEDCLGYRSQTAHVSALEVMENDFAVEKTDSETLMKGWERNKTKRGFTTVGATGMSKEELSKVVEGLWANVSGPGTVIPSTSEGKSKPQTRVRPTAAKSAVPKFAPPKNGSSKNDASGVKSQGPSKTAEETVSQSSVQREALVHKSQQKLKKFESAAPVLGDGDRLGEGDSFIINNILPSGFAETAFEKLKTEISWRSMFHRGGEVPRLVAVQGEVGEDGTFPIYRHPADESPPLLPFSPTVNRIRAEVQKVVKHPINHVLIQHYRHGGDYISEHSDKTLDIARGSKIVNVSLGAQRTMILRTKKNLLSPPLAPVNGDTNSPEESAKRRDMQRIPLPHNSMFVLGLETNQKWLHAIRQDKRAPNIKSPAELAYNGERISLTFRHIATYLSHDESKIHGQGAQAKSADDARPVINGDSHPTEKLLEAFGAENQQSDFDWNACYGSGFDVLHFQVPKPKILTSGVMDVASARIKICMYEKQVDFTEKVILPEQLPSLRTYTPRGTPPVFIDSDRERTTMFDSLAIIQYLEMYCTPSQSDGPWLLPSPIEKRAQYALALNRLQESDKLLHVVDKEESLAAELKVWDSYLERTQFLAGDEFSLVDIAVYPVLRKLHADCEILPKRLTAYIQALSTRTSIRAAYGECKQRKSHSEPSLQETTIGGHGNGVEELEHALKSIDLKED